jgi:hypothetical protein
MYALLLLTIGGCPDPAPPPGDDTDPADTDPVDTDPVDTDPAPQAVTGRVLDGGAPVVGATVRIGDAAVITDARGVYYAEVSGPVRVACAPPDHLAAVRDVHPVPGQVVVQDLHTPAGVTVVMPSGPGGSVALPGPRGHVLLVAPDGWVRDGGAPAVGDATVRAAVLDPARRTSADGLGLDALPGGRHLLAGIKLQVTDADGAALQPASPVELTLPGGPDCAPAATATWEGGAWVEVGDARVDDVATPCAMVVTLPHLSDWVVGDAVDAVTLNVAVVDEADAPVPGAAVTVYGGDGERVDGLTDAQGLLTTFAPAHADLDAWAEIWTGGMRWSTGPVASTTGEPGSTLDLTLRLDTPVDEACAPGAVFATTLSLYLGVEPRAADHVRGLTLATCGALPTEDPSFWRQDVVLYAFVDGGNVVRLDGTWDVTDMTGASPPWVADFGVQEVTTAWDALTVAPAAGYHHDRVVQRPDQVDWQHPLTPGGPPRRFAVRTPQGLYGRLEVSAVRATTDGFDIDVRWQVQPDGGTRLP